MMLKIVLRSVVKIIVVISITIIIMFVVSIIHSSISYHQRIEKLLCETNYQNLLESCRDILKQLDNGELLKGAYNIRVDPAPEVLGFPKAILNLEPSYIYIDNDDGGRLVIEMLGGFDHFGVKAYSVKFNKPWDSFVYGDIELIPGLWYYADGYQDSPEYQKRIDELIQIGKSKQEEFKTESEPNNINP